MPVSISKPLIFVVISVLVVALVYSSISAFNVFAVQRGEAPPDADCETNPISDTAFCCWTETDPDDAEGIELNWCQSCSTNGCNNKLPDMRLEQPPTPPPTGPAAPLQGGGVLQQLPSQGVAPPLTRDQGVIPQEGVLEQEPTDEVAEKEVCQHGTSPTGACYPPPKCPAGTELIAGLCRVPEAAREVAPEVPPEVIEQAPEETPAEEQPSEDSNSEDNGNN